MSHTTRLSRRAGGDQRRSVVIGPVPGQLLQVPFYQIQTDPHQPRKHIDSETLEKLAESIRSHGILQPLLIRFEDGQAHLVAGERRFHAGILADLTSAPCIVTDGDPAELQLIENLQRQDLNPIEEAEALARLRDERGYDLSRLCQLTGKAKSTVSEILSLVRLPEEVRTSARLGGRQPRRTLIEIAKQPTPEAMTELYQQAEAEGLTSDEVKEKVGEKKRGKSTKTPAKRTSQPEPPPDRVELIIQATGKLDKDIRELHHRNTDLSMHHRDKDQVARLRRALGSLKDAIRKEFQALNRLETAFGASNGGGEE